jgi:hypothetical protein
MLNKPRINNFAIVICVLQADFVHKQPPQLQFGTFYSTTPRTTILKKIIKQLQFGYQVNGTRSRNARTPSFFQSSRESQQSRELSIIDMTAPPFQATRAGPTVARELNTTTGVCRHWIN